MKISIGSDHAGFELKQKIIQKYSSFEFNDCGTFSNKSVDYPDFGHEVAKSLLNNNIDYGIVVCGSGIGISIAANRNKGIRAALCTSTEHAKLSRLHNDANVLALGSRLTNEKDIYAIIDIFFATSFEGGRHSDRIKKIDYI
ncbi:MAG: ribose 5-phosphate isomerase B [Candidatus Marinimicrobia bacterium]|nr:ribose 5-phosphate isomerase B [Candidatus Neomarinimicrobiota bacterium]